MPWHHLAEFEGSHITASDSRPHLALGSEFQTRMNWRSSSHVDATDGDTDGYQEYTHFYVSLNHCFLKKNYSWSIVGFQVQSSSDIKGQFGTRTSPNEDQILQWRQKASLLFEQISTQLPTLTHVPDLSSAPPERGMN